MDIIWKTHILALFVSFVRNHSIKGKSDVKHSCLLQLSLFCQDWHLGVTRNDCLAIVEFILQILYISLSIVFLCFFYSHRRIRHFGCVSIAFVLNRRFCMNEKHEAVLLPIWALFNVFAATKLWVVLQFVFLKYVFCGRDDAAFKWHETRTMPCLVW